MSNFLTGGRVGDLFQLTTILPRGRTYSNVNHRSVIKLLFVFLKRTGIFFTMSEFQTPQYPVDDPGRSPECMDVMSAAFDALVRRALDAGWREAEIALALADIADDYVLSVARTGRSLQALSRLN